VKTLEGQVASLATGKTRLTEELTAERLSLKAATDAELLALQTRCRELEGQLRAKASHAETLEGLIRRLYEECGQGGQSATLEKGGPAEGASEQLRALGRALSRLLAEHEVMTRRIGELGVGNAELQTALAALQDHVAQQRTVDRDRQMQSSTAELQVQHTLARDRMRELEHENARLRERLGHTQQDLAARVSQASADQAQVTLALESVQKGFEQEKRNFQAQMENLRREVAHGQEQSRELWAQLRDAHGQLDAAQLELAAVLADREAKVVALAAAQQQRETSEAKAAQAAEASAQHQVEVAEQRVALQRARAELADASRELEARRREADAVARVAGDAEKATRSAEELQQQLAAAVLGQDQAKAKHAAAAHEVRVLQQANEELQRQLERAQQELAQARSAAKREKSTAEALLADLERQLEVSKVRSSKEKSALAVAETTARDLRDQIARLQREVDVQKAQLVAAHDARAEAEAVAREKERAVQSTERELTLARGENERLAAQRRALEERTRRDQSRLLTDVQSQLGTQSDAMRSLQRLKESTLNGNRSNYDRRLAQLGSQVRRLGADLRQERFEKETTLLYQSIHVRKEGQGVNHSLLSSSRPQPEDYARAFAAEDGHSDVGLEGGAALAAGAPMSSTLRRGAASPSVHSAVSFAAVGVAANGPSPAEGATSDADLPDAIALLADE
jgi:chromosome segregation ATPase